MRVTSASTSSGSRPWRARRSLRATTSWRTSVSSPGSCSRALRRREQPRDLGVDVERRLRRGRPCASLRALSIWRISSSCSARAGGRVGRGRGQFRAGVALRRESPPCADLVVHALPRRDRNSTDITIEKATVPNTTNGEAVLCSAKAKLCAHVADCCRSAACSATLRSVGLTDQSIYLHVPAR